METTFPGTQLVGDTMPSSVCPNQFWRLNITSSFPHSFLRQDMPGELGFDKSRPDWLIDHLRSSKMIPLAWRLYMYMYGENIVVREDELLGSWQLRPFSQISGIHPYSAMNMNIDWVEINTSMIMLRECHFPVSPPQSCEMSNFYTDKNFSLNFTPKRVICNWYVFATKLVNPGQSRSLLVWFATFVVRLDIFIEFGLNVNVPGLKLPN